ncbi:hypothetical protein D4S03_10605 [bacterium]|nr:MAG: hypothetical protein D4S03_10605 [bacterium]
MDLEQNLDLVFDVDAVLRGQGADASVLRARSPALVKVAEEAMQESTSLLRPKVVYQELAIEGVQHERLLLPEGHQIESKLLVQHLAAASRVIVILATIGEALEEQVSRIWESNMVYALALDGVGSAAVEALANAACQYFEKQAAEKGLQASIPFSPGMVDWPVEQGQPQIFRLLGKAGSVVSLTPSYIMVPRKSLTMIMGIGVEMKSAGRACDYCTMRESCRYQDHYAD